MIITHRIIELWKYLKGAVHFRFSIIICYLGASFIYPQLWEYIFYFVTEFIRSTLDPDLKPYEIGADPTSNIDYALGIGLIITGIWIFVYFQKKINTDNVNLISVLGLWQNIHDLSNNPKLFNVDNVIKAVSVINDTSSVLKNANREVLVNFNDLRGDDFITVYTKIKDNNYTYNGKAYSTDLIADAHLFYKKLIQQNNE